MSVHINVKLVKVQFGPKGARVAVEVYRKLPDGTTQRLNIAGNAANVETMAEGQTFVINLPEAGDVT